MGTSDTCLGALLNQSLGVWGHQYLRTNPLARCLSTHVPWVFAAFASPQNEPQSYKTSHAACPQALLLRSTARPCSSNSGQKSPLNKLNHKKGYVSWHCMWLLESYIALVNIDLLRRKAWGTSVYWCVSLDTYRGERSIPVRCCDCCDIQDRRSRSIIHSAKPWLLPELLRNYYKRIQIETVKLNISSKVVILVI